MDENEYKYDVIKMWFGEAYEPIKGIIVYQPTIGDIMEYGENDFWSMVTMLCANPTSMRLQLWKNGIDWNKIEDFDLFINIVSNFPKEKTSIIFKDIDFTKFVPILVDEKKYFVCKDNMDLIMDETGYLRLVNYLRALFDIHPKVEKARNKATKEVIILEEEQKQNIELRKQKAEKWQRSTLFPMLSAYLNHPACKYKKSELKELGIFEFMDNIKRINLIQSVTSLQNGMYSGMLDTSKMNLSKELNWMRDLYSDE